jgi:hypothetical protein
MFGMLDYRAHKLYLILFGIPTFVINFLSLFLLPLISYYSLLYFYKLLNLEVYISKINTIILLLVALVPLIICIIISIVIVEIIWLIFCLLVNKAINFIFKLIIDVIPADGRTKEQAELVLYNGDKAIIHLKAENHPEDWDDEFMLNYATKLDWVQSLFYRNRVMHRIKFIREHFVNNPKEHYYEWKVETLLEDNKINVSFIERWVCNKDYRIWTIRYSFLLILLILNPIG